VTTVKLSWPTGSTEPETVHVGVFTQVIIRDGEVLGMTDAGVIEHLASVVKIADGNGVGWKFRSRAYRNITMTSGGPTYLSPFTKGTRR
jgi:hypothetical protein